MRNGALLFFLFVFVLIARSNCEAQLYQWVDDKGTVHFSESPPPESLKSPDNNQDKIRDKGQPKDKIKDEDKRKMVHSRVKNQEQTGDKPANKDDTQAILKRLEVGNRQIPEDIFVGREMG